ncbi:TPA: hypothetical protein ACFKUZ_09730, partial [Neisseria gonorrhoeae]
MRRNRSHIRKKTYLHIVADRACTRYRQYCRNGQGEMVSDFMAAPRADDAAEQPYFRFVDVYVRQARMVGLG